MPTGRHQRRGPELGEQAPESLRLGRQGEVHLLLAGQEVLRRQITVQAVWEVARPVAFSVMIIIIVLVPLFTLQGIEGKMFMPLVLTMMYALLVSLVVALTIVPVLSEMFLKQIEEKEFGFVRRFHHGYLNLLAAARRKIKVTLAVSLIALVAAGLLALTIGTETSGSILTPSAFCGVICVTTQLACSAARCVQYPSTIPSRTESSQVMPAFCRITLAFLPISDRMECFMVVSFPG